MVSPSSPSESQRLFAAALSRLQTLQRREAFDPANLASRPTPMQQQVLSDFGKVGQQWIRAGNQSGKSQTCARLVTWAITDTHPTWKRPSEWGAEPQLWIVCGRTGKQIEDSLLPKLKGFLEPGTFKEVRIGNIIQRLELQSGNRIVFQSLENPSVARERLQSYVAHGVWIDELPPTVDIIRELLIRVQARRGPFLASFTPTIVNVEIQRYVDSLEEPDSRQYRFNMLDNPLYSDPSRRDELVRRYSHLSQVVQDAIFRGDWLTSASQVYQLDFGAAVRSIIDVPYSSTRWRHVAAVDPALKSALGLTIWAEHPSTNRWYNVRAEYVRGIYVPADLVQHVERILSGYNVVRRIADPHEVWYITTAASLGYSYQGVFDKNRRKGELIKSYQTALGSSIYLTTEHSGDLIAETLDCRWSEQSDNRIVNASSYHLLDSAQYFCDSIPKPASGVPTSNWEDWLYQENLLRVQSEQKMQEKAEKQLERKQRMRVSRGRRGKGKPNWALS